jgi:hypothetical protein
MIGRIAGSALVGIALAAALSVGADAAEHRCSKPRGYTVEVKSRYAVVYLGENAYGCLFNRGRRVLLYDAIDNFTLAGRYVAYRQDSYDPDGTVYYLFTVFDLRRERWHTISAAYADLPLTSASQDAEAEGVITDVALKKNGSVAWISCAPQFPDDSQCRKGDEETPPEVWRTDHRGTKLLDASTAIRLRSLKRTGSRITWRHGGKERTATLK